MGSSQNSVQISVTSSIAPGLGQMGGGRGPMDDGRPQVDFRKTGIYDDGGPGEKSAYIN